MNILHWLDSLYDSLFYKQPDPEAELLRRLTRIATREANAIDDLFLKHEVEARIDRKNVVASDTGGFIRYKVQNGSRVSKLTGLEDDISQIVSEIRNDDVTVKIRKPRIVIELPYPLDRKTLEWADAPISSLRKFQALAGMDYTTLQVAPIIIDWSDPSTSNLLVSGETGSGKTNGLIEIVLSLASSTPACEAQFIILDPKFSPAISALKGLPHVTVYNEPDDCAMALAVVKAEVNRRKRRPDSRKLFLVVEELSELRIEAGGNKEQGTLFDQLKSIAQIGREQGVHVIACTQKAIVEVIDTVVRANLPIRLAFKVGTVKESEIATGLTDVDCSRLPGLGAGYYVRNGRAQRLQTHYIDPEELYGVIADIAAVSGEPYRIPMGAEPATGAVLPDGVTMAHIDQVLEAYTMDQLFKDDGTLQRGMKAKVIRLLLGDGAATGGANDQFATKIFEYIRTNPPASGNTLPA